MTCVTDPSHHCALHAGNASESILGKNGTVGAVLQGENNK